MVQCLAPAADMIVASRFSLKYRLVQSYPGSAMVFSEVHLYYGLMERPACIIFEGVCEHQPFRPDDFLIYTSLFLDGPILSGGTRGFDRIAAGELGKEPG